jgi:hypothetical protein
LNTDAGSIAGENLPPEGGRYRPKSLLERNAYSGIGPPYRVAMMPNTINDDIKTRGNAESCRDLQQGSTVRNILDRAIELWCPIAQNDRGTFQYALAWCDAPVLHGSLPALTSAFPRWLSDRSPCFDEDHYIPKIFDNR